MSGGLIQLHSIKSRNVPAEERFWAKVMPEPNSGCWIWVGARSAREYGFITIDGESRRAHRVAWEMHVGPIPEGKMLDHLCRNPACVNPEHLEVVSNRVNVLRGAGRTAQNARKTHCSAGHPLWGKNLRIKVRATGDERICRQCRRIQMRQERGRRRARREACAAVPDADPGSALPAGSPIAAAIEKEPG